MTRIFFLSKNSSVVCLLNVTFSFKVLLELVKDHLNWFQVICLVQCFSVNFLNWPQGTDQLDRVLSQVSIWSLWMPSVHSRIDNSPLLSRRSESYGVCACGWKWSQSWRRVDLLMKRGEPPRASLFGVNNPLNVSVNAMEVKMGWFNHSM